MGRAQKALSERCLWCRGGRSGISQWMRLDPYPAPSQSGICSCRLRRHPLQSRREQGPLHATVATRKSEDSTIPQAHFPVQPGSGGDRTRQRRQHPVASSVLPPGFPLSPEVWPPAPLPLPRLVQRGWPLEPVFCPCGRGGWVRTPTTVCGDFTSACRVGTATFGEPAKRTRIPQSLVRCRESAGVTSPTSASKASASSTTMRNRLERSRGDPATSFWREAARSVTTCSPTE